MKYFAYGVNLHPDRNRGWEFLSKGRLLDYKFMINQDGYATVVPKIGVFVEGVIFEITKHDLEELDEFERYPELYNRKKLLIETKEEKLKSIVHVAQNTKSGNPRQEYFKKVNEGRGFFNLDLPRL